MTVISQKTNASITPFTQIRDVRWPDRAVRIVNWLNAAGIETIGDLCRQSEKDLLAIRQIGKGSVDTIKNVLHSAGLSLVEHCPRCGAPVDAYGHYAHRK